MIYYVMSRKPQNKYWRLYYVRMKNICVRNRTLICHDYPLLLVTRERKNSEKHLLVSFSVRSPMSSYFRKILYWGLSRKSVEIPRIWLNWTKLSCTLHKDLIKFTLFSMEWTEKHSLHDVGVLPILIGSVARKVCVYQQS